MNEKEKKWYEEGYFIEQEKKLEKLEKQLDADVEHFNIRLSELEKWKDNMDAGYSFHGNLISDLKEMQDALSQGCDLRIESANKIDKLESVLSKLIIFYREQKQLKFGFDEKIDILIELEKELSGEIEDVQVTSTPQNEVKGILISGDDSKPDKPAPNDDILEALILEKEYNERLEKELIAEFLNDIEIFWFNLTSELMKCDDLKFMKWKQKWHQRIKE